MPGVQITRINGRMTEPAATIPPMRFELTFHGRVQGVGFRAVAKELAYEHGVNGWVRNEADGTVSLIAEGTRESIEAYLSALRARMGSNIDTEKATESEATRGYAGFEIR